MWKYLHDILLLHMRKYGWNFQIIIGEFTFNSILKLKIKWLFLMPTVAHNLLQSGTVTYSAAVHINRPRPWWLNKMKIPLVLLLAVLLSLCTSKFTGIEVSTVKYKCSLNIFIYISLPRKKINKYGCIELYCGWHNFTHREIHFLE